jgi:uncharacterized protein YceK
MCFLIICLSKEKCIVFDRGIMRNIVVAIFFVIFFSGCANVNLHVDSNYETKEEERENCRFKIIDVILKKGGFKSMPECL